jgi:hypothetical protein
MRCPAQNHGRTVELLVALTHATLAIVAILAAEEDDGRR